MKKIVDFDIVDIIPFSCGIIFSKKEMLGEDKCRVSFYGLDVQKMKNAPVTRSVYLLNKFGNGYKKIVDEIGDYLSCDADSFAGNNTVLVYPSGETGVFDYSGKTVWTGDLMYHGHPVQGVASDGNQIWCAVPEQNAIIQAARLGIKIEGATLYCTHQPCVICAKMIINAGISRVVYKEGYPDDFSVRLFREANVLLQKYEDLEKE